MIKKIWWQVPLVLGISGLIGAGIGFGSYYMRQANPYRDFYKQPTAEGTSSVMQAYMSAIVTGSKVLILPGYTHTNPLTNFLGVTQKSNEPMYNQASKAGYILLDDVYGMPKLDGNKLSNEMQPLFTTQVASAMFRTDLGAFMTGIAIGQFLNENQDYFLKHKGKEHFTWATYGGDTFSSVTGYMGGLQRGINWFNENVVPKNKSYKVIEQVWLGDGELANFTKSFDATAGNNLITQFLQKDVDVLIPVAGTQTTQAVRLINQFKKRCVVIGVDAAAENDTSSNLPLVDGKDVGNGMVIQFSCVKGLDTIGAQILTKINDGSEPANDVGGFGYVSVGTPNNNGVGVSEIGQQYFIRALETHLFTKFLDYETAVTNVIPIMERLGLDKDENKFYSINGKTWDALYYTNLSNKGYEMMPWDLTKLHQWCVTNNYEDIEDELKQWIQNNASDVRKNFTLTNKIGAKDFSNSLIRVIPNSPLVPLLDKSFTQTAYMGVVKYWREYGINIPDPTGGK